MVFVFLIGFSLWVFFLSNKTPSISNKEKTKVPNNELNQSNFHDSAEIADVVAEKSLTEYFNQGLTDPVVKKSTRNMPLGYILEQTPITNYSLGGVSYVRQVAYLKEVIKELELYRFELQEIGVKNITDFKYSDTIKLSDADYGLDSEENVVRTEFFPVDFKNITMLKVGAPVYIIYTEEQRNKTLINPTEIVILNYD